MADERSVTESISQLQANATTSQIQMRVAKKMLDQQKFDGAAVLKLLNAAASLAGKGDAMAIEATGLGGSLDVAG